jgi:hypothetical protein
MTTLEERKKVLNKLANEILREEERVASIKSKSLVGRCYKYHNSYSNEERWWLYLKVLTTKGTWLRVEKIQRDCSNMITYHPNDLMHSFDGAMIGEYIEITPKAYESAKNRIGSHIVNTVDWTHSVPGPSRRATKKAKAVAKRLVENVMGKEK